ncbi:MAG: hypothetical protein BHV65_08085 [Alistipes sp. 58_9_plus]|nr:MAG: hypothetical protein BHV65_08085 [Alistipes sp. 58_9_plus]
MNKSQLIEAVAKDLALPKNEVKRIVESLFKISVDKLRGGEKVVISGFGVFSVALSAARIGRNPRTGAAVKIAPRRTVRTCRMQPPSGACVSPTLCDLVISR